MSISQTLIVNVEHPLLVTSPDVLSAVTAHLEAMPPKTPFTSLTMAQDVNGQVGVAHRQDGV